MHESLEVKRSILNLTLKLINGERFAVSENLDKGLTVPALHARHLPLSRSRPSLTVRQSSCIMFKTPLELSAGGTQWDVNTSRASGTWLLHTDIAGHLAASEDHFAQ
jgi:hypothetical protein